MVVVDDRGFTRGGGESSTVDIDLALRKLSNPVCREMLRQLALEPSNTAEFDRLVNVCAEQLEREKNSIEIQCQHNHIPTLEKAGFIEYDEHSGDVRYFRNLFIEEVLEIVDRWEN